MYLIIVQLQSQVKFISPKKCTGRKQQCNYAVININCIYSSN